jgi:hypothetical protein
VSWTDACKGYVQRLRAKVFRIDHHCRVREAVTIMSRPLITVPVTILAEASYVLHWVLAKHFGLPEPAIAVHDSQTIEIAFEGHPGVLRAPCIGGWTPGDTKPQLSATAQSDAPVLFGAPCWDQHDDAINLAFDPWGMIFWCLARVEEQEIAERDQYGCFSARFSFLFQQGLLLRPIVDEQVDFLWTLFLRLWPSLARTARVGRMIVSCDVDAPYSRSVKSMRTLVEGVGADLLRRHSPATAWHTIKNFGYVHLRGNYIHDPCNTFSWIMDACDRKGLRAVFYFISGNDHPKIDDRYHLTHPFVRKVMSDIHCRGHEIGMHASYVTHQDEAALRKEANNLKTTCAALGIAQPAWGNRQHYLRWDWRVTPQALAAAGFTYDSTLGYNDHVGFRCGTSHPFPLWDWTQRRPLALMERPLIAMDGAGLNTEEGMGLSHDETASTYAALKKTCLRHGGDFVLLWHNNRLRDAADRNCFLHVLAA